MDKQNKVENKPDACEIISLSLYRSGLKKIKPQFGQGHHLWNAFVSWEPFFFSFFIYPVPLRPCTP